MIIVLGKPSALIDAAQRRAEQHERQSSAILLGVMLGLMMAFDMGGPLNKVAYSFAAAGVGVAASRPRDATRS